MNLPPLPEPDMGHQKAPDDCEWETSYSAEAMRAYAAEAVRVALEEAARKADHYAALLDGLAADNFRNCAAAIRALGETK